MDNLDEKLKYEVINELGLFEKVKSYGWKSLSAKETGRIGGLITKKKKLLQAAAQMDKSYISRNNDLT